MYLDGVTAVQLRHKQKKQYESRVRYKVRHIKSRSLESGGRGGFINVQVAQIVILSVHTHMTTMYVLDPEVPFLSPPLARSLRLQQSLHQSRTRVPSVINALIITQ